MPTTDSDSTTATGPQWTPGPWRLVDDDPYSFGWLTVVSRDWPEEGLIARVNVSRTVERRGVRVPDGPSNAALIAAAPQLYAALEALASDARASELALEAIVAGHGHDDKSAYTSGWGIALSRLNEMRYSPKGNALTAARAALAAARGGAR